MKLSSEDYDIFYDEANVDFVYAFNKNGDYVGKPTIKPTWLNDPKSIPDSDRKQIKKRRKDRSSIIPKMKKISKSKSKRLEEIRSDDPQIAYYLNKKKEESTRKTLKVIEYNFQLNAHKEVEDSTESSIISDGIIEEFISRGIPIKI